ncbi:hypothetical protein Murru_0803 [Allomuricauda ruestringensis DSM 13258]|uniref:Uncharacterized protein n=1 Tax=Allomuricauda ruestringensis (strain DSM 13258 / CIP 107369 / LMG 19739 / B1) TaxID=886377 RepID=G2PK78_ALLRU|nr:hypothetical protein [Allomuricauda ruestringensis]AEM69852.1 hypothetical protein Murru_0803 [Allomuricauda ruestringensis DSM 13258]
MLDIVLNYKNLLENLNTYIEESKFKKEHIIKELGVSRATFYNKLKKRSFSVSEMVKLSTLLFPEDVKAMEIKQALERSREDSAAGRVLEHKSVMDDARKRVSQ